MMNPAGRADAAEVYAQLLQKVYPADTPFSAPELSREKVSQLWQEARLGHGGETQHHGTVRVLDFGTANEAPEGPAILRADIECDGQRLRGDIVLHARAEDWEREGCGTSAAYEGVVLHVVMQAPPAGWHTRTATHRSIPILVLPPETLRPVFGCARIHPENKHSLALKELSDERLEKLFRAAAAYRAEQKAIFFEQKAAVIGREQAWFEAWAEVLGYAANKRPMQMLVRRAPLSALRGENAEAILLGTAGFLQALLPERTTEEAREYHRFVWEAWWHRRERFVPVNTPPLPWVLSSVRPMNHPTRRVAALALSASCWDKLLPLMNAAGAKRLTEQLCTLSHPFWDRHCTLASAPLRHKCALVGKARAADFLTNVVYPLDRSEASWSTYLSIRAADIPAYINRLAEQLFSSRPAFPSLLRRSYVQQAILQLKDDFGNNGRNHR